MSNEDCGKVFEADTNKDSVLTEVEAGRYYAAMRVSDTPVTNGKLTP